jgi:hypothetical protein
MIEQQSVPSIDLAICPEAIRALDPNADLLWVKFLRKTGVAMSAKSKKGKNSGIDVWVDNQSRRAYIIRNFGITSLVQRLAAAKDELSRARIWWREAAACAEGDAVPDLSSDNLAVLNSFILTKALKFKDVRFAKLAADKANQENSMLLDPIPSRPKAATLKRLKPGRQPKYPSDAARLRARKVQNAAAQRTFRQKPVPSVLE